MLRFREISGRGIIKDERVILDVLESGSTVRLAIGRTFKTEQGVNARLGDVFWCPPVDITPGDVVVLYSKIGRDRERPRSGDKNKTVFFYWHKDLPLWTDETTACVLFQLADADVILASDFAASEDSEDDS